MSEDKILSKIMDKIDAIEVQTKLNQDAIINAINGVFLSRGIRLLYLSYDENTHGWLYFEDSFLVAAYTETSSALESLKEILSWSSAHVKEYRNVEVDEEHFLLSQGEFLEIYSKNNQSFQNDLIQFESDLKAFEYFKAIYYSDREEILINWGFEKQSIDEFKSVLSTKFTWSAGKFNVGENQMNLMTWKKDNKYFLVELKSEYNNYFWYDKIYLDICDLAS